MTAKRIGILVFEEVEELDVVGPWEVFGVAGRLHPNSIQLALVAVRRGRLRAVHGLRLEPDFRLDETPPLDLLIVPGGRGARRAMKDPRILEFVQRAHDRSSIVASVCTGSLILAAAGLLDGRRATTHWAAMGELRAFPMVRVERRRFIDTGPVVTSAGISAGIDMALHMVTRFLGRGVGREVAHRMEYRAAPARGALRH